MPSPAIKTDNYQATIGIECHVQLNTLTKLFSAVDNNAREARPNTLISHIDVGMPGALPVLNQAVVDKAIKVAFAFGVEPQPISYFERKHYFYPDLPKGYQITQLAQPIIVGGQVNLVVEGRPVKVRINRVQIEEDAGKSTHPAGRDYSLVDLNRAGTPLLEIVSEPDIHSAAEARAYARELWLLIRYAGVSDADLYHGNMRFDVNVSVSKDNGQLGTRTETKNLNSFRSVEKAVEFEIDRQITRLAAGQPIVQETRGWDDDHQRTFSQRTKEEAHDYRYFPEPDLPPIVLDETMIKPLRDSMPILPAEWRRRLAKPGLDSASVESLLEAELEHPDINYLSLVDSSLDQPEYAKALVNWLVNVEIPLRRDPAAALVMTDESRRQELYVATYQLLQAGQLSSTNARNLITQALSRGRPDGSYQELAEKSGFIQLSDESELEKIVEQVMADNPQAVNDIRKGEMKAIGYLVGQIMKASRGQANPALAQSLIKRQLGL